MKSSYIAQYLKKMRHIYENIQCVFSRQSQTRSFSATKGWQQSGCQEHSFGICLYLWHSFPRCVALVGIENPWVFQFGYWKWYLIKISTYVRNLWQKYSKTENLRIQGGLQLHALPKSAQRLQQFKLWLWCCFQSTAMQLRSRHAIEQIGGWPWKENLRIICLISGVWVAVNCWGHGNRCSSLLALQDPLGSCSWEMLGGQGADFLRGVSFCSIRSVGLLRWFCVTGAALRMTWHQFFVAGGVL